MNLSVASVSTRADESSGTNAADEDGAAGPLDSGGESDRRGGSGGSDATAATDVPARRDANETSTAGGDSVRMRLVESTVVAAITGVFVVLGGSTQIAPSLSLPVALAGVLWLFVRTLPSVRRRSGDDAPEGEADADTGVLDVGLEVGDPGPSSRPVGTDRRLKMEIADHGGRMMQKELVEAVDLSESAVSRRLSNLEEEDDEVGRVCLGRENLVYLEGSRPEGADSPFAER